MSILCERKTCAKNYESWFGRMCKGIPMNSGGGYIQVNAKGKCTTFEKKQKPPKRKRPTCL